MIVGEKLAQTYNGLSKILNPETIVIIGPNHYQNEKSNIQTCKSCKFQSIDGLVSINSKLSQKLVDSNFASYQDDTFIKEHAIYSHTPYIKKAFPNAKILPIILKWETPQKRTKELAQWLSKNLPDNSLVIASVDFSHYNPETVANFHDISSFSTIANFDFQNIYNLEIDSPASISTITELMNIKKYNSTERIFHTNNQNYRTKTLDSTTSHQFIAFHKGNIKQKKTITIMSIGNINDKLKSNLSFHQNFQWNINAQTPNTETNPYLTEIRGIEDRFLVGSDFLVFDLPTNTCTTKEQNSIKISFCKFNQSKDIKKQLKTIKKQKEIKNNHIYLQYNFNTKTLTKSQKDLTKRFIDYGVDIFIGKGIKKPLPIEKYKNSIIAYSLGDFITNTKTSNGTILGIALSQKNIKTFKFPIIIKNGKPELIKNKI